MVKLLKMMYHIYNYNNGLEINLKVFLQNEGYDTDKLSNRTDFIDPAIYYVNNYRNEAAHPNFLNESSALNCKAKTDSLLKQFFNSKF